MAILKGDWAAARDFSDRHADIALDKQLWTASRALVALETGEESGPELVERTASMPFWAVYWVQTPGAVQILTSLVRHTGRTDLFNAEVPLQTEDTDTRRGARIHYLMNKVALALIAVANQDRDTATEAYATFEMERDMAAQGLMPGSVSRVLGLLTMVMECYDDAAAHFDRALAFCRNGGYWPELAWVCCEYADILLSRNGPNDIQKALELVEEGLDITDELGMKPLAGRIQELGKRLLAKRRGRSDYPDGLTEREVEVLRLVATGKSNQEIAEDLIISPNTVIRHVSNIFNKIGVSNRAEAASYANQRGLV
jgi:DNA-binding CsgD family transcriptional regulator